MPTPLCRITCIYESPTQLSKKNVRRARVFFLGYSYNHIHCVKDNRRIFDFIQSFRVYITVFTHTKHCPATPQHSTLHRTAPFTVYQIRSHSPVSLICLPYQNQKKKQRFNTYFSSVCIIWRSKLVCVFRMWCDRPCLELHFLKTFSMVYTVVLVLVSNSQCIYTIHNYTRASILNSYSLYQSKITICVCLFVVRVFVCVCIRESVSVNGIGVESLSGHIANALQKYNRLA